MNRRTLFCLALGLAAVCLTSSQLLGAPLEDNQTLKLPGGRAVKLLSVSKVEYSKGVMALLVRYQTNLSVDEHKALSEEVDAVWKSVMKDVEKAGFNEAIITSNEVPRGIFVTANRVMTFIFEKGSDGKWTRLNRADFMAAE